MATTERRAVKKGRRSRLRVALAAAAVLLADQAAFAHENQQSNKPHAATREQQPWGIAGEAREVKRTIEIAMSDDMRFSPSNIEVKQGETIRFVLRNKGKVLHEMVIGTARTLEEHAALMQKFPGMEHDEPHMAHVAAGRRGELVWKFNRAGDFDFACLIPGHYQAGMVGKIQVFNR
jgi:uncharacterized cupredoxin-like copper-binding protein